MTERSTTYTEDHHEPLNTFNNMIQRKCKESKMHINSFQKPKQPHPDQPYSYCNNCRMANRLVMSVDKVVANVNPIEEAAIIFQNCTYLVKNFLQDFVINLVKQSSRAKKYMQIHIINMTGEN